MVALPLSAYSELLAVGNTDVTKCKCTGSAQSSNFVTEVVQASKTHAGLPSGERENKFKLTTLSTSDELWILQRPSFSFHDLRMVAITQDSFRLDFEIQLLELIARGGLFSGLVEGELGIFRC